MCKSDDDDSSMVDFFFYFQTFCSVLFSKHLLHFYMYQPLG